MNSDAHAPESESAPPDTVRRLPSPRSSLGPEPMPEREQRAARAARVVGGLTGIYWLALFVATHVPVPHIPGLPENSDKGMHLVAYAGLAWGLGLWRTLRGERRVPIAGVVFVVCAVYGAADELLQIPVGRQADVRDWIADACGALLGIGLLIPTRALLRRRGLVDRSS